MVNSKAHRFLDTVENWVAFTAIVFLSLVLVVLSGRFPQLLVGDLRLADYDSVRKITSAFALGLTILVIVEYLAFGTRKASVIELAFPVLILTVPNWVSASVTPVPYYGKVLPTLHSVPMVVALLGLFVYEVVWNWALEEIRFGQLAGQSLVKKIGTVVWYALRILPTGIPIYILLKANGLRLWLRAHAPKITRPAAAQPLGEHLSMGERINRLRQTQAFQQVSTRGGSLLEALRSLKAKFRPGEVIEVKGIVVADGTTSTTAPSADDPARTMTETLAAQAEEQKEEKPAGGEAPPKRPAKGGDLPPRWGVKRPVPAGAGSGD